MAICVCRYPLLLVDKRDGRENLFLSLPIEVLTDKYVPIPEIEAVKKEGFDGITKDYIKVKWHDVDEGSFTKKYNVNDHIVIAGCSEEELTCGNIPDKKCTEEELACIAKIIYEVYHPMSEWESGHVLEIRE